jgi:pimeloyl-ACP methyl ester carboxylesterase
MPLIQRGAHTIHYQTLGEPGSPPLLLIMGLGLSSRGWDRLPELMAKRFHVLVFDNRGTGRSGRRGWVYRMRDLADDAAAVIEASGARSAHVFGISMGGMIAQELALRHPERVRALALGCTIACWRKSRAPSWRAKLDLLLLNLGSATAARVGRLLVSREWHEKNPGSALDWIRRADATSIRPAIAQLLAVGRHDTLPRLAQIRAPTLVLTGDADRLIPPQNSEVLARAIPGARLLLLQGAGHAFPLEREEETVRALTDHFLACDARAA